MPNSLNIIKRGSYLKSAGADWILFYTGKEWVSHKCLGCAIAAGLVNPKFRLSTSDHPKLTSRLGKKFNIGHCKNLHNLWFTLGKPVIFQEQK